MKKTSSNKGVKDKDSSDEKHAAHHDDGDGVDDVDGTDGNDDESGDAPSREMGSHKRRKNGNSSPVNMSATTSSSTNGDCDECEGYAGHFMVRGNASLLGKLILVELSMRLSSPLNVKACFSNESAALLQVNKCP